MTSDTIGNSENVMTEGARRLDGSVALVTGASRGIGRASVLALAREGAAVVAVARGVMESTINPLKQLGEEVRALGAQYGYVAGDVREEGTATTAVDLAITRFGHVDLLLNNAGIGMYADFTDCSLASYEAIMDTSMRSTFLFTSAVVPHMKERGKGLILQIASQAGLRGFTREAVYCAAKHAQVGFTRALRQEMQPFGIKVGVICPAGVKTAFAIGQGRTPESVANSGFLEAEDIADAVVFAATQSPGSRIVEMGLMSLNEPL